MSTARRLPAVQHRSAGFQFLIDDVRPVVVRVVAARDKPRCGGIVEVVLQRRDHGGRIGRRTAIDGIAVVHLDRNPASGHERCNRLIGRHGKVGSALAVGGMHLVPLQSGIGRNARHRHPSVTAPVGPTVIGGDVAGGRVGPLMIVHHLRHRRSHAAREAAFRRVEEQRTQKVVGFVLIPKGGQQRHNHVLGHHPAWHTALVVLVGERRMRFQPPQLVGIVVQPRTDVDGQRLLVESAGVGVADDGRGAVIATDDDESVAIADIKHMVISLLRSGFERRRVAGRTDGSAGVAGVSCGEEFLCTLFCRLSRDGCCPHHDRCQQQGEQEIIFSHTMILFVRYIRPRYCRSRCKNRHFSEKSSKKGRKLYVSNVQIINWHDLSDMKRKNPLR